MRKDLSSPSGLIEMAEWRRWSGWAPALLAVAVVAALLCLAAANLVVRANWDEVEDGVLWQVQPEGLMASAVADGTAGDHAGLRVGDVLLAIDGRPVESVADVLEVLHSSQRAPQLEYVVVRLGSQELLQLTLASVPARNTSIYIVLALLGVFTLLVGASVRLRRPGDQATLHFFWLSVAFFGVFAFSYSGRLDRLDWVFYWADEVSILLLAPMFMHFALVFPERSPGWIRNRLGRWCFPLLYLPAVVLGGGQVIAVIGQDPSGSRLTGIIETIWRLEHVYLALCVLGGLAIMIFALGRVRSMTAKRQLRWIVSGAVLGGLPFALGYALPFAMGFAPVERMELTAIPLGLIPLAFASAIVRYRLRDVEIILKRGVVYTAAISAIVVIYLVLQRLASEVFLGGSEQHNLIIALLATLVVVLLATPVKNAIQTMLDRAHYRDRYDYRRALVSFARELNSDLDLDRLSERLVTRVTETLVVDRMALMLAPLVDDRRGDFRAIRATGFSSDGPPPPLSRSSALGMRLQGGYTVVLDDPALARRFPVEEVNFWREFGVYYFVPCVSEEGTIAVLAVGRKGSGEPLSSEDMALLAAVAGQVATALENGRLYNQLHVKAAELERMREFSDNIIESLSDGLVVVNLDDRVVRWNAGLETLYGVPRIRAIGQGLDTLFDQPFFETLHQARKSMMASTALYRVPLVSRHAGGARRLLVNAAMAPLRTPDDAVTGTMVILEDITERVQLEEQLQITEKMASIGLLAAGVAHEVNTPLTGISSFTQILLEGADRNDPRTRLLEKIERQTFRAARIVNSLLNLARPGRIDSGPVDINVVVNDVLTLLEHQMKTSGIEVRKLLVSIRPVVEGVEFKLQQVLTNLFLNAHDAMPHGGCLSISTLVVADQAVVEVTDTGLGIPAEHLSRIYDPFFTTKASGQGTGLGLSITYGVVQEHQGSIECDSVVGQGTRFKLSLPLATALKEDPVEAVH